MRTEFVKIARTEHMNSALDSYMHMQNLGLQQHVWANLQSNTLLCT
jgi:hypothetical protein